MTEALLEARGITVRLHHRPILAGIGFGLGPGRLVMLVGPNGAGKTTLLRALAGLVPAEGHILVGGAALGSLSRLERARRIAYLPQGHQVHWPLAARDVVALGRHPHGLDDPARASEADRAAIEGAMARMGVTHLADRPVTTLSGGERARVMLARVLATAAPILIADEPMAALDPRHQLAVMRDLKAEAARGTLVIAVTHDLGLAARLADEVLLLDAGRLAAIGPPDAVFTPERLAETYGIRAIRQTIDGETLLVPWESANESIFRSSHP